MASAQLIPRIRRGSMTDGDDIYAWCDIDYYLRISADPEPAYLTVSWRHATANEDPPSWWC